MECLQTIKSLWSRTPLCTVIPSPASLFSSLKVTENSELLNSEDIQDTPDASLKCYTSVSLQTTVSGPLIMLNLKMKNAQMVLY